MKIEGIMIELARVRWALFCTLTFRGATSEVQRKRMVLAWLRLTCKFTRTHFPRLKWCIRWECGEITQRIHCHALIGGVPLKYVTTDSCGRQCWLWGRVGGGLPVVRLFDPGEGGSGAVPYLLKGLAGV